jgi:hypothetical protein
VARLGDLLLPFVLGNDTAGEDVIGALDFEMEIPDTFDLIPAEAEDFEPDEEIEQIADPDAVEATTEAPSPMGMTWQIDPDTGLLDLYGSAPVAVNGVDAVRVWAATALSIKRFAHPIFSDNYGMDDPTAPLGRQFDAERNADYIRDVRQTLLVHDRITDVHNFVFRYDPDDTFVEMDADMILDDEDTLSIESQRLAYA